MCATSLISSRRFEANRTRGELMYHSRNSPELRTNGPNSNNQRLWPRCNIELQSQHTPVRSSRPAAAHQSFVDAGPQSPVSVFLGVNNRFTVSAWSMTRILVATKLDLPMLVQRRQTNMLGTRNDCQLTLCRQLYQPILVSESQWK